MSINTTVREMRKTDNKLDSDTQEGTEQYTEELPHRIQ